MTPSPKYPWYITVNPTDPLEQGDFVKSCPVFIPVSSPTKKNPNQVQGELIESDVIVLTQSCDLASKKIDMVLVCPYYTLDHYSSINTGLQDWRLREGLRRGHIYNLHLLDKCDIGGFDNLLVVEFKNVYGVPFKSLENHVKGIGNRVRLLPPYREHLSQAFARFFMRVGLPLDIPEFKKK